MKLYTNCTIVVLPNRGCGRIILALWAPNKEEQNMKQPNSLVQFSINDIDLDSLSECAGQILAKEEAMLVIGRELH